MLIINAPVKYALLLLNRQFSIIIHDITFWRNTAPPAAPLLFSNMELFNTIVEFIAPKPAPIHLGHYISEIFR